MSSSAGLADSAKRSRIKRKAVRPPVAGRPLQSAQEISSEPAQISREQGSQEAKVPTIEPSEVETPVAPRIESDNSEVPAEKPDTEKSKSKKKKKTAVKKIGHTQPRFEVRLSGDHEKLVEDIQRKAYRESLPANKGINNSELFGGFLEAIRPYRKDISFSLLDFKRGKLYGDGTERIKVEVGKSIQRSSLEYFLSAIESGEEGVVGEVLSSLPQERLEKIALKLLGSFEETEEDEEEIAGEVANG